MCNLKIKIHEYEEIDVVEILNNLITDRDIMADAETEEGGDFNETNNFAILGNIIYEESNNEEREEIETEEEEEIENQEVIKMKRQEVIVIESEEEEEIETEEEEEIETEEEEDEIIKTIRRENERQPGHPPNIICKDLICDISFHPQHNILAVGNVHGDVIFYSYANEANTILKILELHTKGCRDIEFNEDGEILFSTSTDKSIILSNVETGSIIRFYDNAHDVPIYCLTVLDENVFATGDDKGLVKLWDLREKGDKAIFSIKKNEDYISDIITNDSQQYLVCSSGDGSVTSIDLNKRQLHMQSEYQEELTCLGLFRNETKLLAGSSRGTLFFYNWNEFGLNSDAFPGPKLAINSLVPITEDIVVAAYEDGNLRATHLFPHRHLGVVGQHDLSVEHVDICNNGKLIASSGINNDIKFWNIEYFEEWKKISHKHNKHNKRKEMEHNLPSSKRRNVADFFGELC